LIVLDASAAIELLLDRPAAPAVAAEIQRARPPLHAPHLIDAEVGQVLRRFLIRGDIRPARAKAAVKRLAQLRLVRSPHLPLLGRALELRGNVTVCDGLYLALAEALVAPLLTLDAGLARIPGCRAVVVAVI
jgi:predicted nucleic acid-binding protein